MAADDVSRIAFFVAGKPRAMQTGSVVTAGGRSFPIRRNATWAAVVGLVARQHAPAVLLEGPLVVDLLFHFRPPRTATRRRHPVVRPDGENLAKGILDALNGVLYHDDSQVVDLLIRKRYSETEGVRVDIRPLPDDWHPEYRP